MALPSPFKRVALWLLGTRLLAWAAMVVGSYYPAPNPPFPWHEDGSFKWLLVPHRLLDVWGRWDSAFYVSIAEQGYPAARAGIECIHHAAYYPLFPALMRGLSVVTFGVPVFYTGLFLANAALLGALVYLWRLAKLESGDAFAEGVLLCVLAYPGSHFLSIVYPDSLTLFFGAFAVWNARVGRPWVAGLTVMLAAVTRSSGGLIAIPVLYELLRTPEGKLRLSPRVLVLLLPLLTVVPYLMLEQQLYQDPLYFMHVQGCWGRHASNPLEPLFNFDFTHTVVTPDYPLFVVVAAVLTIWAYRKKERPGHLAYATIALLLPLSTGMLRGIHRYLASNFPLYFFGARWMETRPRFRWGYRVVGVAVMVLFAFQWGKHRHPN